MKGTLIHVDFVRVRADQTIQAEIPVHLVGEAEGAVRGGVLEQLVHTLTVEAKPADFPPSIEHDVSALEIGGRSTCAISPCPAGVTVLQDADELVAQISAPRVAEEVAARVEGEGAEGAPAEGGAAPAEAAVRGVAGSCPSTSWWSGSAIPATSTRGRATTSAPRSSSCSRAGTAASCTASKGRARVDDVRIGGKRVALAIPLTYMNDSGEAVGALARRLRRRGPTRS